MSGYGTDSVASTVYNGISQLKGTNAWVNLAMAALAQNVVVLACTMPVAFQVLPLSQALVPLKAQPL